MSPAVLLVHAITALPHLADAFRRSDEQRRMLAAGLRRKLQRERRAGRLLAQRAEQLLGARGAEPMLVDRGGHLKRLARALELYRNQSANELDELVP